MAILTGNGDFDKLSTTEKTYVILTSNSVHVPAEGEWAPGHGYPAHTEYYPSIQYFSDEFVFLAALRDLESPRYGAKKDYRAFVMNPVSVDLEVTVRIATNGA